MSDRFSAARDYFSIRYVGSYDRCPAKSLIAYTLSQADEQKHAAVRRIIVRDLLSGRETHVTAGGISEHTPRFAPDGSCIAFLSDATGTSQIHITDLASGATRQLTGMRFGAGNLVWSPKGDRIAFLSARAEGQDSALLQEPLTEPERKELDMRRAREPVVIEDFGYKSEDAMGFAPKETSQLWVIAVDSKEAVLLTDGDRDHVMPVWSPDGESIVFASNRCRPRTEVIGMDLFQVPAAGGEIIRLTDEVWIAYYPASFQPLFSPDGEKIIFGALAPSLEGGIPRTLLYSMPRAGGKATLLFPDDAPCHEATCFLYNSENLGVSGANAQVSSDGTRLYFISGWHGSADIYSAALEGEPHISRVTEGAHTYRSLGKPADGQMLVMRGDFSHTPQLFMRDEETGRESPVTDSNPWFEKKAFSRPEEIWFGTLDGEGHIQGWVLPPQGELGAGKKYPAVLYIHGGPTPFYGCALTYEHQAIAGAGIGVMFCNPRGSSGYGEKHQSMKKAFDGTAMYDLLQFVEEAVRRFSWIDPDRIGVTGGSYGGYMTSWLVSHTKRFKAAVTQRSVANEQIQYASSDMAGSSEGFESFQDFMVRNIEKSAVAYADNIDIPFLILHGQNDMRCPVEHAHQLFVAVKDTHPDLPVRMVLFPKSNHSMTIDGPMHLRVAHYEELIGWFRKYL